MGVEGGGDRRDLVQPLLENGGASAPAQERMEVTLCLIAQQQQSVQSQNAVLGSLREGNPKRACLQVSSPVRCGVSPI